MSSIKIILTFICVVIALSYIKAQTSDQQKDPNPKVEMKAPPPPFRKGMKMRHDMFKHIKAKLHLTDQQVSKIKELKSEHMKNMIDLKADLKKNMIDLKDIRMKDNFTRQDIIAGVEKSNKIKNNMALALANHRMDVWELLTPEQKEIVKDNPKLFGGDRKHRMMHKRF
jgi:Spy/CpxP family protein refolding chaperone